jgi:putative transposase
MSWVRVWVQLVFSTKNREPFLNSKDIRKQTFQYIKQNSEEKGIWLDTINGFNDHTHCLISLSKEQTISKVAQLIKGESSFWINKNKITEHKFVWQNDYWAVSVSENQLQEIRDYIQQQEGHHAKKTFTEEVKEFMEKYGWKFL